ncbi:Clavaminate synthase-like protein [Aspergillus steynii IBT 23096]|uniref:Clavaminate synthase-like protein n=1 Tax=Aspergillus steynii IBT 23096 TaxID=1392250 RepID=A0A2I2G6E9_9EURO|nr:Clavaminate synthase-like protein [Aspergillus steynii IBT 23096]PLB48442.1 Clavaminate synthase-like protein [Aspergillus steynii IBT 23096]
MGSLTESYPLPLVSYADLLHDDKNTRDLAASDLIKSLNAYGACFFERPLQDKMAEYSNSNATSKSRFVPYASEKIRGMTHLDETLEFQHGVYDLPGTWDVPGSELVNASKDMHEECNRIHINLLDCLSSHLNLPQSLNTIHSKRNSFFAPYYYYFDDPNDTSTLRVPPHIDPTTMLFCFQDSHAGLNVADMSDFDGNISTGAVQDTARFVPANCKPGEFLLLAGHILRRLVDEVKHSVHFVERPLGSSGYHLNYWIIPDFDTACDFGGRQEDVAEYLARVFPAPLRDS